MTFKFFSEALFLIVFAAALLILLCVLGREIMRENNKESSLLNATEISSRQVAQYFIDNGYVVCNVSPVKNENKWFGYLIKNGEYLVATAFTNGESVERHIDSLEQ